MGGSAPAAHGCRRGPPWWWRRGQLPSHSCARVVKTRTAGLVADLFADSVLLLIQHFLLVLRDVAAVLACHHSLLPADLAIVLVDLRCLFLGQVAMLDLLVKLQVLHGQPLAHSRPAPMIAW